MRIIEEKNSVTPETRKRESGFTLVELAIATAVLLFGVVAVVQLVPAAMQSNLRNRQDTTSAVAVQRLHELFSRQNLSDTIVVDPNGLLPCTAAGNCLFGDTTPGQSDRLIGARVRAVRAPNGRVIDEQIDFSAAAVQGYNFIYVDPNDAQRAPFEVRWAVITNVRNVGNLANVVVSKRVIVGARRQGDRSQSVSFSTLLVR